MDRLSFGEQGLIFIVAAEQDGIKGFVFTNRIALGVFLDDQVRAGIVIDNMVGADYHDQRTLRGVGIEVFRSFLNMK